MACLWSVGPGSGTLDHLMGVKVWDKADISVFLPEKGYWLNHQEVM